MKTIDKIIKKVNTAYGAPMGRGNTGQPAKDAIIYDCAVPMVSGGYDKGGAYWGLSSAQLRVRYTRDLSYIEFYWSENNGWIVTQRDRKLGAHNYRTGKVINPLYSTFEELKQAFNSHR